MAYLNLLATLYYVFWRGQFKPILKSKTVKAEDLPDKKFVIDYMHVVDAVWGTGHE